MTGTPGGDAAPERGEVAFAATSVSARSSRRPAVAAGLLAAFVVLAIVKPWEGPPVAPPTAPLPAEPTSSPPVSPLPAPSAAASVAPSLPAGDPPASEAEAIPGILGALRSHPGWGARVVLEDPRPGGGADYIEQWYPVAAPVTSPDPGPDDIAVQATAFVARMAVRAIGVTAPPGTSPLDLRVWRLGPGPQAWLDVAPLVAAEGDGRLTILPPRVGGVAESEWPSGLYRLDLLLDDHSIARVSINVIAIPSFGRALGSPSPSPSPSGGPSPAPTGALASAPTGLFALVGGHVVALNGIAGVGTSPAGIWYASLDPASRAVSIVTPPGDALVGAVGFTFGQGLVAPEARLERLAGQPLAVGDLAIVDSDRRHGTSRPSRVFVPAAGGGFEPGVYALDVRSGTSATEPWQRYVVVIRPGTAWPSPFELRLATGSRS